MRNLYRKKLRVRNPHETALDVLSLPDDFYENHFQKVARHWAGETVYHADFPPPPSKLLPSALATVATTEKHTLAALLGVEAGHHANPKTEFHSGGGLSETASSIFSSLWNWTGAGPLWRKIKGVFGKKETTKQIPEADQDRARLVQESYKSVDERDDRVGKWIRLPKYDTDRLSVWMNPDLRVFDISIRGTKMNLSDIVADLHIVGGNKSGKEDELEQEILDIIKTNTRLSDSNEYTYELSGHSLGANQVMNILADSIKTPIMERVKDAYLFNPGITPTHDLDVAKRATNQERFHWFLNSGDIVSNAAISIRDADSKSEVFYGTPGTSPAGNHSLDQWTEV